MSHSYRFGDCRIDPARRELWRGGRLVALPPQAFDFLVYLIERHKRAVGRDELVAAVWGKTEISDTVLGQTVLRLRRELGDDAREQRLLRTIPRFGYRWVAALQAASDDDDPAPTHPMPAAPDLAPPPASDATAASAAAQIAASPADASTRQPRRLRVALVAVLILVLAAAISVAVMRARRTDHPAATAENTRSSAVLPAEVDPSAEWAWTRLGVMDMVAARLRSSGVPSVPSEEVVAFLNTPAANRDANLRQATATRLLVQPRVHHGDGDWRVDLDAQDASGEHYVVDARDADLARAARAATDKLTLALGARPRGDDADAPYAAFVQRVDAAVLADDPDGARRLIEQASPEQRAAPELRLRLAKLDFRAGKLEQARERLLGLLEEAPAQTAPRLRASILNGLGAVAIRADQPQQAQQHFDAAIALLATQTDAQQLGQAYLGRAAVAADEHRFDAALADYARARVAFREANDALALLRVAANEGFLDLDQDRPGQALPQLRAATDGFRQWGALNEAIFTSIGQINAQLALLDGASAMQVADAAAALAQRIENRATVESLRIARARALLAVGRLREARSELDDLRRTTTDPITAAVAGAVLARLELDDNRAAAGDLAQQAVATLAPTSLSALRADAWLTQVRALIRAGNADSAASAVAAFEQWAAQHADARVQVFAQLARAEHDRRYQAAGSWRAAFDAARAQAEHGAVPLEIASVERSYADGLLADGDLEAAQVAVGRVSRWASLDFACAVLEARLFAALGRDGARQAAVARAQALAGERTLPADALSATVSTHGAAAQ